jgi:DNA repair exonuclease SbcCD ATPase subunit
VSHFTLSTDAERKNLLESILGLSRFDVALARCREDLKVVQTAYLEADQSRSKAAQERHLREQWAEGCQKELEDIMAQAGDNEKLGPLGRAVDASRACVQEIEAKISLEKRDSDRQEEELFQALEAKYGGPWDERCEACGQLLGVESRATYLRKEAESIRKASAEGWRQRFDILSKDLSQARIELAQATEQHSRCLAQCSAKRKALELWNKRNGENQAALDAARAQEEHYEQTLAGLKVQRSLLGDAEQVLGLRGVRSFLLAKALGGIEDTANHWLSRMTGRDLKLELKSYTEKADGNTIDSISLDILGAGGGYGYKAASQGERRRIDVALLLALSEVAASASGRPPGTLWVDEAFDALDEEGTDAIVEILGTLSQTRAVVVISHSEALVSKLPKAKHVHLS